MNLYAIRDIKADAFAAPFLMANDNVAIRAVSETCTLPENRLALHPGDYQLWSLGSYDEPTGKINSQPELVCNVSSLVANQPVQLKEVA